MTLQRACGVYAPADPSNNLVKKSVTRDNDLTSCMHEYSPATQSGVSQGGLTGLLGHLWGKHTQLVPFLYGRKFLQNPIRRLVERRHTAIKRRLIERSIICSRRVPNRVDINHEPRKTEYASLAPADKRLLLPLLEDLLSNPTEEELTILYDGNLEQDPSEQEVNALKQGHELRIVLGILDRLRNEDIDQSKSTQTRESQT
jgi:hypothetical protein